MLTHCFFSYYFFLSDGGDWSKSTWTALILKMQGTPQKTAILISDEGTVNKNDSKSIPPNPKPIPARIYPIKFLKVRGTFLSQSEFEKRGFLLNKNIVTIRIWRQGRKQPGWRLQWRRQRSFSRSTSLNSWIFYRYSGYCSNPKSSKMLPILFRLGSEPRIISCPSRFFSLRSRRLRRE